MREIRPSFRRGAAILAFGMSVALSGCAGSPAMPGDQTFTKDQSNRFVISAADLPSPGLGDESTGGIKRVGVADSTIDQFWRVRNVAVVLSAGPLVAATDDGVLRMARNISARAVR